MRIYCEVKSKPSAWDAQWNTFNCPVIWGYFDKSVWLEGIITFKGYSFGVEGQIAVGFDIDYEAKALYEELTGNILEIGVVFAGYENLMGQQPLDKNASPIKLDKGKVIKTDLSEYEYKHYDFVLTDVIENAKDIKLVVAACLYDGEFVKYIQENGISNIVSGISYNEAKEKTEE